MPVRIVEGQLPYTGGTGIEIDANKVISLLLREENNLILVNDDNEIYTDLQLASNIRPTDDFPVGVTTGKILQSDGWTRSGLLLNRKTTSGDYARWIYANDGKIYFDNGTGTWKQVYYSSEIDGMIQDLNNYVDLNFQPKLTAGAGITIDQNNVISAQGAGTGDVVGPASSTDGHLAVFDGATGKIIKDGGAIPTGDVGVSTDTGTLLSAGVDLWLGTETDFSSISTPDSNTLYIQYKSDSPTPWQPGANTVGYRPLNSQTEGADMKGFGTAYDLTGSYRTFGTYGGVDCVYVSGGTNSDARLYNSSIPIGINRTASIWFYSTTSNIAQGVICTGHDYLTSIIGSGISSSNLPYVTDWTTHDELGTGTVLNSWHLMTVTYDGTTAILYIDGTENARYNYTRTSDTAIAFSHKTYYNGGSGYTERFTGYLSEAIYEDKVRTAQEIADYYNQTKADYGIS